MSRYVTLPNGRAVGLGAYVQGWKRALALAAEDPETRVPGFQWYEVPVAEVVEALRDGIHDRINRHDSAHGRGRKWDPDYQVRLRRDAQRVRDWQQRRTVRRGSGAETREGRRGFALAGVPVRG